MPLIKSFNKNIIKTFIYMGCFSIISFFLTFFLTSPSLRLKKVQKILSNSQSANTGLLDSVKKNKIVFIGDYTNTIDEKFFLIDLLPSLYDAGLRYIFFETTNVNQEVLVIQNSWQVVKYTYSFNILENALQEINNEKNEKIQIISLYESENEAESEKIILAKIEEIIENTNKSDKILLLLNSAHGQTEKTKVKNGNKPFTGQPLGVHLKKTYGNDFSSYIFLPLSNITPTYFIHTKEWGLIPEEPKLVSQKEMNILKLLLFNTEVENYTGFIVQKTGTTGILFNALF